ncbi:MAG: ATP-binding cassette domain-containing protein [Armatimonadaceae bacterium]|jgi:ABC-2 type transport system ATP-binding protein
MNEPLRIDLRNITKRYDKLTAVDNLSLALGPGEIFGFIGPNGAGKTTTIKILATLLEPTTGTAFVDGINVVENPDAVRARIGYMPDTFGVYDEFKVWEYLDFFAAAYKVPKGDRPGLIDLVLDLTNLSNKKDAYVEGLSRGMKQRLCLARTMVHNPKVLLLDEPASGLDPRARIEIRDLLKELRNLGKTIIVSSHILPELADFCTSVGIIEKGKLLVSGPIDSLIGDNLGARVLEIKVPAEDKATASKVLAPLTGVRNVAERGEFLDVQFDGGIDAQNDLLLALITAKVRIVSFGEVQTDLEAVFMNLTRGLVA